MTQAVPVFVWNRFGEDGRYRIYAEFIPLDLKNDTTSWIQERIAALVRENPEQWVWIHDRWGDDGNKARVQLGPKLSSSS